MLLFECIKFILIFTSQISWNHCKTSFATSFHTHIHTKCPIFMVQGSLSSPSEFHGFFAVCVVLVFVVWVVLGFCLSPDFGLLSDFGFSLDFDLSLLSLSLDFTLSLVVSLSLVIGLVFMNFSSLVPLYGASLPGGYCRICQQKKMGRKQNNHQ